MLALHQMFFFPKILNFWVLMMSFGVCGSDNCAGLAVYRSNRRRGRRGHVAQQSPKEGREGGRRRRRAASGMYHRFLYRKSFIGRFSRRTCHFGVCVWVSKFCRLNSIPEQSPPGPEGSCCVADGQGVAAKEGPQGGVRQAACTTGSSVENRSW